MADRAALFGQAWSDFYREWAAKRSKDACWPAFMAATGIAASRADEEYMKAEAEFGGPDGRGWESCTLGQMNALMRAAFALMTRIGTYDYTGVEFADEYDPNTREENVVDA